GGVSAIASVLGTFFARIGKGDNAIIGALYKAVIAATILSALGFIPVTKAFTTAKFDFTDLYVSAVIGLVVTFALLAIPGFYTGTRREPGEKIARASPTRPATSIIHGLHHGPQATPA